MSELFQYAALVITALKQLPSNRHWQSLALPRCRPRMGKGKTMISLRKRCNSGVSFGPKAAGALMTKWHLTGHAYVGHSSVIGA